MSMAGVPLVRTAPQTLRPWQGPGLSVLPTVRMNELGGLNAKETSGPTQDTVEGLRLSSALGTPGGSLWRSWPR